MNFNLEMNGVRFHNAVVRIMKSIADDYQSKTVQTTSRPSAPDTSKFSSIVYGMIEYSKDVYIHGGTYGGSRQYLDFMKIGKAVDSRTRNDVFNRFVTRMYNEFDIDLTVGSNVITTDYKFFFMDETGGSAWGGFGFQVSKLT